MNNEFFSNMNNANSQNANNENNGGQVNANEVVQQPQVEVQPTPQVEISPQPQPEIVQTPATNEMPVAPTESTNIEQPMSFEIPGSEPQPVNAQSINSMPVQQPQVEVQPTQGVINQSGVANVPNSNQTIPNGMDNNLNAGQVGAMPVVNGGISVGQPAVQMPEINPMPQMEQQQIIAPQQPVSKNKKSNSSSLPFLLGVIVGLLVGIILMKWTASLNKDDTATTNTNDNVTSQVNIDEDTVNNDTSDNTTNEENTTTSDTTSELSDTTNNDTSTTNTSETNTTTTSTSDTTTTNTSTSTTN